jgi:hypothetical protein
LPEYHRAIRLLEKVAAGLSGLQRSASDDTDKQQIHEMLLMIRQKMSFSAEMNEFYLQVEQVHKDFRAKLESQFPDLRNRKATGYPHPVES